MQWWQFDIKDTLIPMTGSKRGNVKDNKSGMYIASEMIYYALPNCFSCVYLLPVINFANSNNLIGNINYIQMKNKVKYIEIARPIIDRYFPGFEVFSPLIIMNNPKGLSGMVKPDSIQELTASILEQLNVLGDDARIDYLDGDLEMKLFFRNMLFIMAANLQPEIENP